MAEKLVLQDRYAVSYVAGGTNQPAQAEEVNVPFMKMDADLWVPGPDGKPVLAARVHMPHNLVVHQGRALVGNRLLASWTSYNFAGMFLHSASQTTNASAVWTNISGSQVTASNGSIPIVTFATAATTAGDTGTQLYTASASYAFNAVQTVSGAGLIFGTTNTIATNFASADGRLYCYGTFASLQAANPSTLSVTASMSMA